MFLVVFPFDIAYSARDAPSASTETFIQSLEKLS
jgi:hypothetical protein